MTLEEYKASPASWNPTFTVANLADYTKWQNRTAGNDYERVKVTGNVTATAGIDLSYSQTKQVVFNDGVTLTLNLNEAEGRCFYRSLKEYGAELWMYKPRISAKNTKGQGCAIYGFQYCDNIWSPTVASITVSAAAGSSSNKACCFGYCNNIENAVIEDMRDTDSSYAAEIYGFYYCDNIGNAVIKNGYVQEGAYNRRSILYGFYYCDNLVSPTVEKLDGPSNASYIDLAAFRRCEHVSDPKAVMSPVSSPSIESYINYYWSGLIINRAGSVAKTALFDPSYGPLYLLLSDEPRPGQSVTLSWAFINADGTSVSKSASLSVTFDGGATWTSIYTGTNTSYAYTVPSGKESVKFRVGSGTSTGYCSSENTPFTAAPVISGTDTNLGVMADAFAPYTFSIAKSGTDTEEWSEAAVTVTLDGKTLQSLKAALGVVKTVLIGAADWKKVPNGEHTLKISARRIVGGMAFGTAAARTLSFTRTKNRAVLALRNAARSDTRPAQIMLSVAGAFPSGSSLKAEACNNANDPAPAWEDMTAECLAGTPHTFSNGTKTAGEWGVNFRVTLERKTATGDCYVNAVSGEYS